MKNPIPVHSPMFGPGIIKAPGTAMAYAEFCAPGFRWVTIRQNGTLEMDSDDSAGLNIPIDNLPLLTAEAQRILEEVRK